MLYKNVTTKFNLIGERIVHHFKELYLKGYHTYYNEKHKKANLIIVRNNEEMILQDDAKDDNNDLDHRDELSD